MAFFDNGSSSSDSSSFLSSSSPLLVSLIGFDDAAAARLARGVGVVLLFVLFFAGGAFLFGDSYFRSNYKIILFYSIDSSDKTVMSLRELYELT